MQGVEVDVHVSGSYGQNTDTNVGTIYVNARR
jgi:hypothetical protein